MKIVLVHGIFNTGHVLFWMKWILEKNGYECFAPNLWPFDGRKGIEYAAEDLKKKIGQHFEPNEEISIIGFSMGGIVARYYLQNLDGYQRAVNFFR